jgi:flagellar hook-length control protein FliK
MNAPLDLAAGNAAPATATAPAPRAAAPSLAPEAIQPGPDAAAAATADPGASFEALLATLVAEPTAGGNAPSAGPVDAPADSPSGAGALGTTAQPAPGAAIADAVASLWQMLPGRAAAADGSPKQGTPAAAMVPLGSTRFEAPATPRALLATAGPSGAADGAARAVPSLALDAAAASALVPFGAGTDGAGDDLLTRAVPASLDSTTSVLGTSATASPSAGALQTAAPAASLAARDPASSATSAHAARAPVATPVGAAGWGDELAQRLNMLIDRGDQSATLRLSPEHLGPLEVRISVRESEANVWFGAAHAETRSALEASLPRLRELLAGSGLALTQSGVSQRDPRDAAGTLPSPQPPQAGEPALGDSDGDARSMRAASLRSLRLLDVYA